MKKIFCYALAMKADVMAIALAEDGEGLVKHVSSNTDWAKTDLGINGAGHYNKNYDNYYGAGQYELVWVDDPLNHPGVLEANRLNREKAYEDERNEAG